MSSKKDDEDDDEDDLVEFTVDVLQGVSLKQFVTVHNPLLHACCWNIAELFWPKAIEYALDTK